MWKSITQVLFLSRKLHKCVISFFRVYPLKQPTYWSCVSVITIRGSCSFIYRYQCVVVCVYLEGLTGSHVWQVEIIIVKFNYTVVACMYICVSDILNVSAENFMDEAFWCAAAIGSTSLTNTPKQIHTVNTDGLVLHFSSLLSHLRSLIKYDTL